MPCLFVGGELVWPIHTFGRGPQDPGVAGGRPVAADGELLPSGMWVARGWSS